MQCQLGAHGVADRHQSDLFLALEQVEVVGQHTYRVGANLVLGAQSKDAVVGLAHGEGDVGAALLFERGGRAQVRARRGELGDT